MTLFVLSPLIFAAAFGAVVGVVVGVAGSVTHPEGLGLVAVGCTVIAVAVAAGAAWSPLALFAGAIAVVAGFVLWSTP